MLKSIILFIIYDSSFSIVRRIFRLTSNLKSLITMIDNYQHFNSVKSPNQISKLLHKPEVKRKNLQ